MSVDCRMMEKSHTHTHKLFQKSISFNNGKTQTFLDDETKHCVFFHKNLATTNISNNNSTLTTVSSSAAAATAAKENSPQNADVEKLQQQLKDIKEQVKCANKILNLKNKKTDLFFSFFCKF